MDGEGQADHPHTPGRPPGSDPSVGVAQFPLAPQPSIIRAQQKVPMLSQTPHACM